MVNDWRETPDAHLDPVVAASYDTVHTRESAPASVDAAVAVLADVAGDGAAVEFAIGTGRIAVPLSNRGVSVSGMDISEPMLEQLRTKPGADSIHAVVGDMTSTTLGDDFAVAYLVYNTIMNLRTQQAQVACFANAARHLRPEGRFVIEVMVPELHRLGAGETVLPFDLSDHHLGFDEYVDLVEQILLSHHVHIDGDRVRRSSPAFRYVWPSELDLMARLAGLELEHRWADWQRTPFDTDSTGHVSVWRKPAPR
ncbi:MAG: class I SAM-dependent DNA methyltransferase [Acidimicrobiales bacterium]